MTVGEIGEALSVGGLTAMYDSWVSTRAGYVYNGLSTPGLAFRDANAARDWRTVPAGARIPGGFEGRWWESSHEFLVLDFYGFHSARDARRFVREFATPRCRAHVTISHHVNFPNAVGVAWSTNHGRGSEVDIVFARGADAYRVGDEYVDDSHVPTVDNIHGIAATACFLPASRCAR